MQEFLGLVPISNNPGHILNHGQGALDVSGITEFGLSSQHMITEGEIIMLSQAFGNGSPSRILLWLFWLSNSHERA